jgi:uncharacterized protein YciI
MFIVSLSYKATLDEVDKHMAAHIDYVKAEFEKGNFVAAGRKVPRTGGLIFSTVESREALDEILMRDPFAIEDLVSFDITEMEVTRTSQGLEALKS